jgi:Zn-finger nucleic acid-binding protein
MGRHEEAIRAQEMTQRRFPLDLQMSMDLEGVYLSAGRLDQAIDQARITLEVDQNLQQRHHLRRTKRQRPGIRLA